MSQNPVFLRKFKKIASGENLAHLPVLFFSAGGGGSGGINFFLNPQDKETFTSSRNSLFYIALFVYMN